jgi:hypothetical protein
MTEGPEKKGEQFMEKKRRRRAWKQIMALFLAVFVMGTTVPLESLATAGAEGDMVPRESEESAVSVADEAVTDEAVTGEDATDEDAIDEVTTADSYSLDNVAGVKDACDCADCSGKDTCTCEDHCGESHSCTCDDCYDHAASYKFAAAETESESEPIPELVAEPGSTNCKHESTKCEPIDGDCYAHLVTCLDCGHSWKAPHHCEITGWIWTGTCECGLQVEGHASHDQEETVSAHNYELVGPVDEYNHKLRCTRCGRVVYEGHDANFYDAYAETTDCLVCGYTVKHNPCPKNPGDHEHARLSVHNFTYEDCMYHKRQCPDCGAEWYEGHIRYGEMNEDGTYDCRCGAKLGARSHGYNNAHDFKWVSLDDDICCIKCSSCGWVNNVRSHTYDTESGDKCIYCGHPKPEEEPETTIATPPAAATNLVYNGETQTGVPAGTGYTITGNTGKDAGDYTAIARLEDGYTWTDGSTDAKTIEWSIAPAELTEVTLTETVFYYNGEVQRPDVTEVKAGDLIVPSEDYTVVYEGGDTKDPGTYRVLVRKEFGKNNVTGGVWATYEIKKGAVPPTAKTDLVYNGKIQIGIEEAETSWIGYKVVGYTEKDAGDYIATATLDEGYIWTDGTTDPKNIKWSIAPAPLTEIVLSETTLVYDGTVQKPDITSVLSETIPAPATDYEIEWSDENSKDIGTYAVKAEGKGNFTGVVTAMYKISTEVTPPTAKTDLYYTGKEQTGVEPGKGYSIKDNKGTDAGSYKATATLDKGYVWTDGTSDDKEISWSIEPAELTSVGVTKTLYFYDGSVHKPDVTLVRAGAITVPDTDYSLSWSNENSQEVGFYTVEATATSKNYTGTATATYEISNGIAKVPTAKTGLVYKGWTLTGVEPGTGYTLRDNTGETAGNYIATATLEEGFEWEDGSKAPKTIPWSIAQAPITGMTLSERTFTYNGSVQRPGVTSVHAGNIRLKRIDYTISWSDENSKDVGIYTVTVRGTENFTGVITSKYAIESMETWNLFEDGSTHVYSVRGITSKKEVQNKNSSSSKFFTAVLVSDTITVSLKEGADRKKAATANIFDFDLGEEGAVSYTLPFTYNKPVLKLSVTKGTVTKGKETTLKTKVLYKNEDGNFIPYDLSGAEVTYAGKSLEALEDGDVAIVADSKASDKIKISREGWNEKDPIELQYTIAEVKESAEDVLAVDMGGLKQVTLNRNHPEQSFTFPLTLNGEKASAQTVQIVKGKKGEESLAKIGKGTVTISLGKSSIGKGSYTINLKPVKESKAKFTIKVNVTEKAITASGKIALKMDVVTRKPMIIIPTLKEGCGEIKAAEVTDITLKNGKARSASDFTAEVKGSYIEVSYVAEEEMKASDLKIGDMTLSLTVLDSAGAEAQVPLTLKNVTAKKTAPSVKSSKVVIPKATADKADGTTVIATANIRSSFKDSAKHTQNITPTDVTLTNKNVVAETDPADRSRILIKKLTGKSGTIKATLTYAGGVTKTVTVKVTKK